jgi:hypothetical protein
MYERSLEHLKPLTTIEKVELFALPYLRQGRKNWDEPHTRLAVEYMIDLAKYANEDILVFATVAWMHDTGYSNLFKDINNDPEFIRMLGMKKDHMIRSRQIAERFLNMDEIKDLYTEKQKKRILHLVVIHDDFKKIRKSKDIGARLFLEADTLAAISCYRIRPTFNFEEARYHYEGVKMFREPLFISPRGFHLYNDLMGQYKNYIGSLALLQ